MDSKCFVDAAIETITYLLFQSGKLGRLLLPSAMSKQRELEKIHITFEELKLEIPEQPDSFDKLVLTL
jgi:hypothetical protein